MSRTLIVMIGAPGSGKSTLAEKISQETGIACVTSDKVREALYGNEEIQGNHDEVFRTVYNKINKIIDSKGICILDATNVARRSRKRALGAVKPDRIIYIVKTASLEECLENNRKRDRFVPENVIKRMHNTFLNDYPAVTTEWYPAPQILLDKMPDLIPYLKGIADEATA